MEVIDALDKGGVIGILVFIILSSIRKWWVPGWLYDQAIAERDAWKIAAIKGVKGLESAAKKKGDDADERA